MAIAGSVVSSRPILAAPVRPERRLPTLTLLRTIRSNTLSAFDAELFDELIVMRRYGLVTVCFVSDPAGLKRVLVDNSDNYPRLETIQRLFEVEIATGTLGSTGEVWERHRRVAVPSIDHRAIRPDLPALIEISERFADELGAAQAGKKKPFDVQKACGRLIVELMNEISTGGDPDAGPIMKWLAAVPRKPRGLDLIPKPDWLSKLLVRRNRDPERVAADQQLQRMIADRLDPGYAGRRDLLWRLAHTPDRRTGETLPAIEARDEAVSLLAAADATVRALTWVWYLLALHPEIEAKLHAEIDALGDRPLTPEALREVPFAKCVLDEAMRLYPPVPVIVRKAKSPDEICGRRIPKGALVVVAPFVIHRHTKLWSDPERFDPDRFSDEGRAGRPRLAFLPFSVGPRVCPGASASDAVTLIAIVALARTLRFRLAPGRTVTPFGGISLEPLGGLMMRAQRR